MKCFYHHDRDAVGTCKSCGKGLCVDCAVDLGKGLACRDRCEDEARAVIGLIDQNVKMSPKAAKLMDAGKTIRTGAAVFNLVLGAVFVLWGLSNPDRLMFLIIVGGCFLAYGIFSLFKAKQGVSPDVKTTNSDA